MGPAGASPAASRSLPANEPLGLHVRPDPRAPAPAGVRRLQVEFSSRGDRVPARLWLPAAARGPAPLVLLLHDAVPAAEASPLETRLAAWAARGLAALALDLPLHGEREDRKLAERLPHREGPGDGLGPGAPDASDPTAAVLQEELAKQVRADLGRALDAVSGLAGIDPRRVACVAVGAGADLAGRFLAGDPRPRAVALVRAGGGLGGNAADLASWLRKLAPRPLLLVNATDDPAVPRSRAQALHAAAGDSAQVAWVDASGGEPTARALEVLRPFVEGSLVP